jgi:phage anti-repressor protein
MMREEEKTPIEIAFGVDEEGMTTAKKLYAYLELNVSQYSRWVRKNIEENIFAENGSDYEVFTLEGENPLGGRPTRDYKMTSSFAKKLAMSSQTRRGQEVLEYYVQVEQYVKDLTTVIIN